MFLKNPCKSVSNCLVKKLFVNKTHNQLGNAKIESQDGKTIKVSEELFKSQVSKHF